MKLIRVMTEPRHVQLMISTEDGARTAFLTKPQVEMLAEALSRVHYNVYGEPKQPDVTMLEMGTT